MISGSSNFRFLKKIQYCAAFLRIRRRLRWLSQEATSENEVGFNLCVRVFLKVCLLNPLFSTVAVIPRPRVSGHTGFFPRRINTERKIFMTLKKDLLGPYVTSVHGSS